MRHRQNAQIARVFDSVPLQRAEIICVAQLTAQLLEDRPVTLCLFGADLRFQMLPQVSRDPVIVEQRIIHIKEEDYLARVRFFLLLLWHGSTMSHGRVSRWPRAR